jgi:hypothetical protein
MGSVLYAYYEYESVCIEYLLASTIGILCIRAYNIYAARTHTHTYIYYTSS